MWQARVVCSSCAEEDEVVVVNLDDLEWEVCRCGYSHVVLSIASFEPVNSERVEPIALPRRRELPLAA